MDEIEKLHKTLLEKYTNLKSLPEDVQKDIIDWIGFRRELTIESDRGCALLAASHLDFLLQEMLKSKMVGTNKQLKALFDFNGALGTFSSRIQIAYSIGLLSKTYVNDLQIIRKIRNEFGHSPSVIDFDNEKISGLCNNLDLAVLSNKTNKAKFITSVAFISGGLTGQTFSKKEKFVERKDVDIEKTKSSNEEFKALIKNELEEIFKEKK